jgi:thioredoxin 2
MDLSASRRSKPEQVMIIQACPKCGAKNRVDEQAAQASQPVCGRCGEKLSLAETSAAGNSQPQTVTDATFATDVLEASGSQTILVDCWAAWCGPCRMIAPVLDELAVESNGRYKIAKLNVDENPRTAAQFNIRSIPTLLIFKNGKVVDQIIGVVPKQTIAARLAV